MRYPFEDASTLHFEVDNLGDGSISVVLDNGHVIDCDRVDLVMVDHVPFIIASLAVQEEDDEPVMYPRDVIPHANVLQIRNHNAGNVKYLGVEP